MDFDFANYPDSMRLVHGLPHPNWTVVSNVLDEAGIAGEDDAWRDVALEWMDKMCDGLGSEAMLYASPRVVLLSTRSEDQGERLVNFAERTLATLHEFLPDLAQNVVGPYVILLFDAYERFYDYVTEFFGDGEYGGAGGIYLNAGYGHIAIPSGDFGERQLVVAHEMTHAFTHLHGLPLWLDEALAMRMEQVMLDTPGVPMDIERQATFSSFWSAERIQHYWTGFGFAMPDDTQDMCYELSRLLFAYLLERDRDATRRFVAAATWEDAGEAAARAVFRVPLGDLMRNVLGPGDWNPDPESLESMSKDDLHPLSDVSFYSTKEKRPISRSDSV